MFAGTTLLHPHRRAERRPAGRASATDRAPMLDEVERLIRRLVPAFTPGEGIELVSMSRASDGSRVWLECSTALDSHTDAEHAGAELRSALDPMDLGVGPSAMVCVSVLPGRPAAG